MHGLGLLMKSTAGSCQHGGWDDGPTPMVAYSNILKHANAVNVPFAQATLPLLIWSPITRFCLRAAHVVLLAR